MALAAHRKNPDSMSDYVFLRVLFISALLRNKTLAWGIGVDTGSGQILRGKAQRRM